MTSPPSKAPAAAQRIAELKQTVHPQGQTSQSLEQQLDWFKRQVFGRKREKREWENNPQQPPLKGVDTQAPAATLAPATETLTDTRKKQRSRDWVNDSGLRFDAAVAVQTIGRTGTGARR